MMQNERKVLGKGLSALLSDTPVVNIERQASNDVANKVEIELGRIRSNPWQPRVHFDPSELENLSESIRANGVIQPIIVRKSKNDNTFELIAGERRVQASRLAGKTVIPAIIVDLDDDSMLEHALIENIQRQDLNAIEEAKAYKNIMTLRNYTQEVLAKQVGKSRSHVANMLRLLSLPEDVQVRVASGEISAGHARSLIGQENASDLASQILNKKLNVRDIEQMKQQKRPNYVFAHENDSDLAEIEKSLSECLGMSVKIKDSYNGGIMSIQFLSLEQLDTLIKKLTGESLL